MERPGEQRELVYCHECENEFYKDQRGLVCPRCHSDFTEIIEDRSADLRRAGLSSLDPWAEAPDPDEDDITSFAQDRPGMAFGGRFERGPPQLSEGPPGAYNAVFAGWLSMLQNLGGLQNFEQRLGGVGSPLGSPLRSPPGSPFGQPQQAPRSQSVPRSGFPSPGGNRTGTSNFSFSVHTTTYTPDGPREFHYNNSNMDLDSFFGGALGGAFGGPHHPGMAGPGGFGGAGSPGGAARAGAMPMPLSLQDIFSGLFNPANARMGDAVFSQEALDRIMTQLMEEHQSGSAPGPASEAAINALPKRPAGPKEVGETGEADCSICMDTVTTGTQVTILPCNHWFHPECVKMWLSEHDTCPVCRSGITPKDGDRSRARHPSQAPLHNEDPAAIARRQSGSREHPFVVPESPTSERRRPTSRRHSSSASGHSSSGRNEGGGSGGIAGRLRNFLSGSRDGSGGAGGASR